MFSRNLYLAFIFSFALFIGRAQSAFVKGYIISLKGDTIWGEAKVNPKKENDNFEKILFKDTKGQQKSYDSDKILGFGYKDKQYVVMEADGENLFFLILTKGAITMYKQMFPGFRMNKVTWETEYYITDKENPKPLVIKEFKVKKQLSQHMQDNLEFINTYNEEEDFDAEKTLEIITKYNNWKRTSGT
jgi:hypothetical protein